MASGEQRNGLTQRSQSSSEGTEKREAMPFTRCRRFAPGGGSSELDLAVVVGFVFGDMEPLAIVVGGSPGPAFVRQP